MRATSGHDLDVVIDERLYIGNLASARNLPDHPELGVTHVVSVCPDFSTDALHHLRIDVQDWETEDLLFHLPGACRFIQAAIHGCGKVLVHCVMGISRSATVIAAYLMMTRGLSYVDAISYIRQRRPQVQPNYGFIKQLQVFAACNYEPSRTNPTYRAWKRRQRQDVNHFLTTVHDTTPIIPDKLYLSSDFPRDLDQAACLVSYLGMTHCVSITPAEDIPACLTIKRRQLRIPDEKRDQLLLALPDLCKYIEDAINNGGRVLVHCLSESCAATVVCAFLMWSRKLSSQQAHAALQDALPLFNCTARFTKQLEVFASCNCAPRRDQLAMQAWLGPTPARPAPVSVAAASPSATTHMATGSDRAKAKTRASLSPVRRTAIVQT